MKDKDESSNSNSKTSVVGVTLAEMMENEGGGFDEVPHAWGFEVPQLPMRNRNSGLARDSLPDWTVLNGPRETDVSAELRTTGTASAPATSASAVLTHDSYVWKRKLLVTTTNQSARTTPLGRKVLM